MNVWLWDTAGPGGHSGITDTQSRARTNAGKLLTGGKATTARVELAHAHLGGPWIHSGYERTGTGLTAARNDDGTVQWTPFHRPRPSSVMNKPTSHPTRTAAMADTESLISEWEASGNTAQKVAAGIARTIAGKSRYDELPLNSALAAQWDVSRRTVSAAKSILHDHGILIMENRRYYVA